MRKSYVPCNAEIKFKAFLDHAIALGNIHKTEVRNIAERLKLPNQNTDGGNDPWYVAKKIWQPTRSMWCKGTIIRGCYLPR